MIPSKKENEMGFKESAVLTGILFGVGALMMLIGLAPIGALLMIGALISFLYMMTKL